MGIAGISIVMAIAGRMAMVVVPVVPVAIAAIVMGTVGISTVTVTAAASLRKGRASIVIMGVPSTWMARAVIPMAR
jgi:hypothetical protein